MNNKFETYQDFVESVTSDDSNDTESYIKRLKELNDLGLNMALLDTAATGLASESGELLDVIKKLKFHGKPFDDEVKHHIKRELGDIIFYFANACRALDISFDEVLDENIKKLSARYPGGFDAYRSEHKESDDI